MSFRGIPTILTPQELMDVAFSRAAKIEKPDRDRYHRQRKTTLGRLEGVRNVLNDSLERYVRRFPSLDQVAPYHRELIGLLIGEDRYRLALGRVDRGRKNIVGLLNRSINDIATELDIGVILDAQRRAYGRVSSLLRALEQPLAELARFRETIRRLPEVAPDLFTVVVAGYPNVGKSSLIRALTDAEPEVASYPFTTKAALVGHLEIDVAAERARAEAGGDPDAPRAPRERAWGAPRLLRVQIIDTPGLLDRPEEERNAIEKQAALAVRHLADLVLFLRDPTGHCGYPVDVQENLLDEVRRIVPDVELVIMESKADLGDPQRVRESAPQDAIRFSTVTGEGLEDVRGILVAAALKPRQDARLSAYLRGETGPLGA